MKKKIAIIILILLAGLPLISAVFPRDYADYLQRPLKDKAELTFDNLSTGTYMSALEDYLSDRFAFKPEFLSVRAYTNYLFGVREYDNIIAGANLYQRPLANDRAEKFIKNNDQAKVFAIPYKMVYTEDLPKVIKMSSLQRQMIKKYYSLLGENLFKTFDAGDYYRGDHHLNENGVLKLIDKLGLEADYKITDSNDFRGGLSRKTGFIKKDKFVGLYIEDFEDKKILADGKEIKLYNFDKLDSADPYLFYLSGNYGVVDIEGTGQGSVTIIKDSFANPTLGFFAKKYKHVRAIDPRFLREKIEDKLLDGDIYVIGGF